MTSNVVLEISFPAELQTVNGKQEDVRPDVLHLRMSLLAGDIYDLTLWSESDVFVQFASKIDRSLYDTLRREQQLVVGFEAFPASFRKLLQGCITEKGTQAALLLVEAESASLHIVCKMEHKIVELLSCPFRQLSDNELKLTVQKRFVELRMRAEAAEAKVAEFTSMMRSGKVPSLFNKGHAKTGAW